MSADAGALSALAVAVGGAAGAVARCRLDMAVKQRFAGRLPLGTLVINVLGCLVLGLATAAPLNPVQLAVIATGFCGGFTTFSTLCVEVVNLLRARHLLTVAAYLLRTIALGTGGFLLGAALVG